MLLSKTLKANIEEKISFIFLNEKTLREESIREISLKD